MRKFVSLLFGLLLSFTIIGQNQNGFNYQAVIRNAEGQAIANQMVGLRISIQNAEGTPFYTETHTPTTSPLGVVSVILGNGTGSVSEFESIPWEQGDLFLNLEVDPSGGSNYTPLGASKLQSVPYALYAQKASEFVSPGTGSDDDPIFVVRNNLGQIVFAVYQTGVRVFVEDTGSKSARGGFAVGGLSGQNKQEVEYLRVTPDSVRVNVNNTSSTSKSSRGGFAVGGLSGQNKALPSDLLYIAPEMARIYVDTQPSKSSRGGFAVGGLSGQGKSEVTFLNLTPENYFIGHESGLSVMPEGVYNSTLGYQAGKSLTTGRENIFIGYQAGYSNLSGSWNTFLGYQTGYSNSGSYNTFIGYQVGKSNTTGIYNVFLGYNAGLSNLSGGNNLFVGNEAGMMNSTGANNVFLGYFAGYTNNASNNVFLGNEAGRFNSTGTGNAFMGYYAGRANSSGNYNSFIGFNAGLSNTTGANNVFIGNEAGRTNTVGASNVFLGYFAGYTNNASNNVFLGNEAGRFNSTGTGNAFMGYFAGRANTSGNYNSFIGFNAGLSNTTGTSNVFIGNEAGRVNTTGTSNVFLGYLAGYTNNANNNVFLGNEAGRYNSTGTNNAFMGYFAGMANTSGINNVFIGNESGRVNTTGSNNVFLGNLAGYTNNANNNVFLGNEAGRYNTSGTNNAFIGYWAGRANTSGSSNLFLGNNAGRSTTLASASIIMGNNSAQDVTAQISSSIVMGDNALTSLAVNIPVYRSLLIGNNAGITLGEGSTSVSDCIFLGTNAGEGIKNTQYSDISGIVALGNNSGKQSNGYRNVFIGNGAGTSFVGHQNTMIGFLVGTQGGSGTYNVYLGDQCALQANGDNNTYIGRTAGTWVNGSNNIFLGFNAGAAPFSSPRTESNRLRIGSSNLIYGEFDNQRVAINTTTPTQTLDVNGNARIRSIGSGTYLGPVNRTSDGTLTTSTSDVRMKENIKTLSGSLSSVLKLRGVSFTWISEPQMGKRIGLIAQEVEQILPELVFTNDVDGYKGVNYAEISAVLVEAVKEQQSLIEGLTKENQTLRDKVSELEKLKLEVEMIKSMLTK
jgi:hypothetical protein